MTFQPLFVASCVATILSDDDDNDKTDDGYTLDCSVKQCFFS